MTTPQIDTTRMPFQSWTLAARPLLQSHASSPSLVATSPQDPSSARTSKAPMSQQGSPLGVQLFDNAAQLKIFFSQIAMHLSTGWRTLIFEQIDRLLDLEEWEEESSLIQINTFSTFLRFIIYASPTRLPSLGVNSKGHLLAAWIGDNQRITVQFLPDDHAVATCIKSGTRAKETVAWRGHIVDLKVFIERFGVAACMARGLRNES